jgi:hypothetical protein
MEVQPILHVWVHQDDDLVDLTVTPIKQDPHGKTQPTKDELIHTNKKHPFFTAEKGFLPVGQIKIGMHVVQADGSIGLITGWVLIPGVKTMYNLEVAQDHTFTVGDEQWVVHNCGGNGAPDPANKVAEPDLYEGQRYDPNALRRQGYKLSPGDTDYGALKSDSFKQFLREQGQTNEQINNWEYVMEKWKKRGSPVIKNHYWRNMWDFPDVFYHHHE